MVGSKNAHRVNFLLIHSPPVELEEVLFLVSAGLEDEAEVMDALCTADLGCELLKLVLCAADIDLTYELAVEVVKSDLDRAAVEEC